MSDRPLRDELPKIYRSLLPGALDALAPQEAFATCQRCAMVPKPHVDRSKLRLRPFSPDRKCCTYWPSVPNYLVGEALASTDPALAEGRQRLIARIEGGNADPIGLLSPNWWAVLYASYRERAFGLSETLLCPYFDRGSGGCTIWAHREAICSTYFCKSTTGGTGKAMWNALREYLQHVEASLAQHVLVVAGFGGPEVLGATDRLWGRGKAAATAEDLDDGPVDAATYAKRWGSWRGREVALYARAAEIVGGLTSSDLESIVGVRGAVLLSSLDLARGVVMTLPDRLVVAHGKRAGSGEVRRVILDRIDVAFDLPEIVLRSFDGTPTREVLARLEERGIALDEPLVRTLYHNGWLVEAT